MAKITRYASIALSLGLLLASASSSAELKIGVVNVNRLLENSPQAIAAQERLEKEFASRDQGLLADQKELKRIEDKLARDTAVMSEAERGKAERDLRARKRELRRALDELREDKTIRMNDELAKLQRVVNEVIREIGKVEGYDLIIYEGIIFVDPKLNLTDKLLERMQNEAGARGG